MMKASRNFVIGLLVGGLLMFTATSIAQTVKQYMLVEPTYPLHLNGAVYENAELPMLNYEGNTYIPLKAVADVLGASVYWNEVFSRVEIEYIKDPSVENSAFRNLKVSGSNGQYTVTGEARVFEANMSYAVSDGHNYLVQNFQTLNDGAPEWSAFQLDIVIAQDKLPVNGTLTIEVFEYSAKDGSVINLIVLPLETFTP